MSSILRIILITILFLCNFTKTYSKPTNKQLTAAGSSTIYPFITIVAEEFARRSNYLAPIIESIGTGGGFKMFCSSNSKRSLNIVTASRAIKDSEIELCKKNNIENLVEIKFGYDGIVIINSKESNYINFTRKNLFLALAKKIPYKGRLVKNTYIKWSDIDKNLPNNKIKIYGPPPSSGTRDSFTEIILEEYCVNLPVFKAKYPDKHIRKDKCKLIRSDGHYLEAGENDNLIIQKIISDKTAFGLLGFNFLEHNKNKIKANYLNNIKPSFETIADNSYLISRPLFIYTRKDVLKENKILQAFIKELLSDDSIGEYGYLLDKGLIPISDKYLTNIRKTLNIK